MLKAIFNWKKEFPAFAESDMPAIPAGWIDSSWHNDACPSFVVMAAGDGDTNYEFARVWIAESDPAQREFHEVPRFQVSYENGELAVHVGLTTDDWQEVLAYVEVRQILGKAFTDVVGHNPFLDAPETAPSEAFERLAYHAACRTLTADHIEILEKSGVL